VSGSALTILHISDPHFGTEQEAVVAALLQLCSREQPDVVILSGDITQRARGHQFTAAARFFSALSAPHKLAIPGNHDIPLFNLAARVLSPYGGFRKAFGEDLEPEISLPDLLVIGVNTTRPGRHEDGEVSAAQVAKVKARLEAAQPAQLRIVVTHQPVHVITAVDCKNRLHGASEALHGWADAGADLILGGHIHLPYVRRINEDIPLLSRPVWAVQAGTAVSTRIRGGIPNSVNIIRHSQHEVAKSCSVERWDYAAGKVFAAVQTTQVVLEPH
jgi:3',5'-cyclic AMP phosphodiesterase CpdA